MKKIIIIAAICGYHSFIYSQGLNNLFMYGYNPLGSGTIDFKTGFPINTSDSTRPINLNISNANITSSNGDLLFYTNGVRIVDSSQQIMQNGDSLNPSQYTSSWYYIGLRIPQSHIFIPMPGDTELYYLFHETINTASKVRKIYYSIINKSLNNGLGKVTKKNMVFLQDTLALGQLTACKHANGRDWWLIVPEDMHPAYYVFLITPDTIELMSKQTIGNRIFHGQAAFSPDGTHYGMYDNQTDIEIFDFDRCNGIFSNYRYVAINDSNFGLGFSFSPNSRLAYASSAHHLYQVNLDSANLSSSLITVAEWDSTYDPFPPSETGFMLQQLSQDNKLYLTTTSITKFYHVIDQPDSPGIACNVIQHGIQLLGTPIGYNDATIPNHPNYFLGPVIGSVCDSLGLGVNENVYKENLNLRINPNPATNSFYLNYQLPTGKDAMVYIYNTLGKLIHKQQLYSVNQNLLIYCNTWQAGVYYLKMVMDKGEFEGHGKVVVIR